MAVSGPGSHSLDSPQCKEYLQTAQGNVEVRGRFEYISPVKYHIRESLSTALQSGSELNRPCQVAASLYYERFDAAQEDLRKRGLPTGSSEPVRIRGGSLSLRTVTFWERGEARGPVGILHISENGVRKMTVWPPS